MHGDAQQRSVLEEEHVGDADVFVACTGDDEDNIIACVEALELGVRRAMAIVARPDYANVVSQTGYRSSYQPPDGPGPGQGSKFSDTAGRWVSRIPLAERSGIFVLEIEVPEQAPATRAVLAQLDLPPKPLWQRSSGKVMSGLPAPTIGSSPGDTVVVLAHDSALEEVVQRFSEETSF